MVRLGLATALAAISALIGAPASAEKVLRIVPHADLKIVDPVWTTAYITRNHGYMIYDTLFAMDAKGEIRPQMIDRHSASADGLVHEFVLRDGLEWHDGKPVTAEDCVASLKRWAARDSLGKKVWEFVSDISVTGEKTFTIKLKERTGLLIYSLGKPSSNVPFMMPKRVAETDPGQQINDTIGSGPFIFKREEWKPGEKIVYVKNQKYKPRAEPPSWLAGGKLAMVDRVEWRPILDQQQAMNALIAGEIDLIEIPSHDLLPVLTRSANVKLLRTNPYGNQYTFRLNHLQKPFDNPKIRHALWYVLNQQDFLEAVIGNSDYYQVCKSIFICSTDLETKIGMDGLLESNLAKARALLAEAGYDGQPVVLLHPTNLNVLANLAPVAKSLMEKAGFKVDMQAMDWQTLVSRVSRKGPPSEGGWHLFITAWNAADILNPVMNAFLDSSCEKSRAGWPCDAEMEKLRDAFARAPDAAAQKRVGEAIQKRNIEWTQYIPLGQWYSPIATRKNVTGLLDGPVPVFWNVKVD